MPKLKDNAPFLKFSRLLRGYTNGETLATVLDVHPNTARKRLRDPSGLTLTDIKHISQRLHIPVDEIRQAITW